MRILRITGYKSPGAHTDNRPPDCYLHAKASGIPEFNRPSGDGTLGENLHALARTTTGDYFVYAHVEIPEFNRPSGDGTFRKKEGGVRLPLPY